MTGLSDLAAQWRTDAATLRRRGAVTQAVAVESCADELERELARWEDQLLSITEAAAESGLSEETLRRHVRLGKLPGLSGRSRRRILGALACPAFGSFPSRINRLRWSAE